ncbi:TRAP transporter large permease subunit [Chloroflexota bacterium]
MIDISPEIFTIIMIVGILVGVLTGFPLGLVLGSLGLIIGFFIFGTNVAHLIYQRSIMVITSYVILAVPLFVFMGNILERSGITERLYDALYVWLGAFRGGLAIATVIIGTILAACVGIIAASITMLSLIAVPSMLKRGYSKSLAAGATCAGGTLGILIPPSVMLVIYGPVAGISVGKLFFGAFLPGFTLSLLYCSYIAIRSFLQPSVAPAIPVEERKIPFMKKTLTLAYALVPPALLILSVLGSIFFGIAPPTEAAGIGASAAVLLALAYRKLTWKGLAEAGLLTVKICGMIFLIFTMSQAFVGVFVGAGGAQVVNEFILATPGGKWGAFAVVMFMVFILGMFIDFLGIILIIVPIINPIIPVLGFDPLWFGIMICVNLQMSFMTPPFAPGLFIAYGTIPKEWNVTMGDIIRGAIPFVILIMVGLILCVIFPQIILWLPGQMIK